MPVFFFLLDSWAVPPLATRRERGAGGGSASRTPGRAAINELENPPIGFAGGWVAFDVWRWSGPGAEQRWVGTGIRIVSGAVAAWSRLVPKNRQRRGEELGARAAWEDPTQVPASSRPLRRRNPFLHLQLRCHPRRMAHRLSRGSKLSARSAELSLCKRLGLPGPASG